MKTLAEGDNLELTCIVCPNGCRMSIEQDGGDLRVEGALCPKGKDFALAEMTNPMRSLTTTVRTVFPDMPKLPVKTAGEIPKGKMLEAMGILKQVTVTERLKVGDVILPDVCGVAVVATASM